MRVPLDRPLSLKLTNDFADTIIWGQQIRPWPAPCCPIQNLSNHLCFCVPAQAFSSIAHPLLPQLFKKIPVAIQISQNFFDLKHYITFVSERHFEADLGTNNVSGATEVDDHWYCTHRQSLEDHRASEFVNRGKYQHVDRSQALYDFAMA